MKLFMMIFGPRQLPENEIDVYLCLLVKDLTLLWVYEVEIFYVFFF